MLRMLSEYLHEAQSAARIGPIPDAALQDAEPTASPSPTRMMYHENDMPVPATPAPDSGPSSDEADDVEPRRGHIRRRSPHTGWAQRPVSQENTTDVPIGPTAATIGGQRRTMQKKALRRRNGEAKRILAALVAEQLILTACDTTRKYRSPTYCGVMCADLAEAFAGVGRPTRFAASSGLGATRPAEIDGDWDLSSEAGQQRWRDSTTYNKPWLVLTGYLCAPWNRFTCNFNRPTPARRKMFLSRRFGENGMEEFMALTMRTQHDGGRWLLFGNPP